MELTDVFDLSRVSNQTRLRVKRVRIKVKAFQVENLHMKQRISIFESFIMNPLHVPCFEFVTDCHPKLIDGTMNINNNNVDTCKKDKKIPIITCCTKTFKKILIPLLTYLCDLFCHDTIILEMDMNKIAEMKTILKHRIFSKCLFVKLGTGGDFKSSKSYKDLHYVLKKTSPILGISFFCDLEGSVPQRWILNYPRVLLQTTMWLEINDLKNMNSEVIIIENQNITCVEINSFIHHWLAENSSQLKRFALRCPTNHVNYNELLRNVNYELWDQKRRPRYFRTEFLYAPLYIDCKTGFDIKRNDGLIATVAHINDFLEFLIWSDQAHK